MRLRATFFADQRVLTAIKAHSRLSLKMLQRKMRRD